VINALVTKTCGKIVPVRLRPSVQLNSFS